MKLRLKIAAIMIGAVSVLSLAVPLSANAASVAKSAHRVGFGPWNIKETSGNYWVGASNLNPGTAIWEASGPRDIYWETTAIYNGETAGFLRMSNALDIRSSLNCSGVYLTANPNDNGTIWVLHPNGNGHYNIINRYCDQHHSHDSTWGLAGANSLHLQYIVSPPAPGEYRTFDLHAG